MWSTQTDKNTFLFSPLPWYFCNFGSNSAFFDVTDVHRCSKVDSLFLVFPELLVLLLTFSEFHAGIVSSFSHSLSTAASASWIFFACEFGINVCTKLWWVIDVESLLKMRSSCFVSIEDSTHCLVDSWDSTIHSHIVFIFCSLPIFGFALVLTMLGCLLYGMAEAIGLAIVFLEILIFFRVFSVVSINKKCLSVFDHCRALACLWTIPVFSRFWAALQFSSKPSIHTWSCLVVVWIFVSLYQTHMYPFGGFSLSEWFV